MNDWVRFIIRGLCGISAGAIVLWLPQYAMADLVIPLDVERALKISDIVVRGEVISIKTDPRSWLLSFIGKGDPHYRGRGVWQRIVTIRVDRNIKGFSLGRNIEVRCAQIPPGTYGENVTDCRRLVLGDSAIYFLERRKRALYLSRGNPRYIHAPRTGFSSKVDSLKPMERLLSELQTLANNANPQVAGGAIRILRHLDDPSVPAEMDRLAESPHPRIRAMAIGAQADRCNSDSLQKAADLGVVNCEMFWAGYGLPRETECRMYRRSYQDYLAVMIKLLKHRSSSARHMAINYVAALGTRAVPYLVPLANDPDDTCRRQVHLTLCKLVTSRDVVQSCRGIAKRVVESRDIEFWTTWRRQNKNRYDAKDLTPTVGSAMEPPHNDNRKQ